MLIYSFDGYMDGKAAGWVFDADKPLHHFTVSLMGDQGVIGTAEASTFRQDLLAAGLGQGTCAFFLELPEELEGKVYLVIEDTGQTIAESVRQIGWGDDACTALLKSRDFSKYNQFKDNKQKFTNIPRTGFARSSRLLAAFNRVAGSVGDLPMSALAAWAIERNRRGGAGFFSVGSDDAYSDYLWYLFDYNGEAKEYEQLPANSRLFADFNPEIVKQVSLVFLTWLLRRGKALPNMFKIEANDKCEFLGAMTNARLAVAHDPCFRELVKTVNVSVKRNIVGKLPKFSKYLQWKHKTGYLTIYPLDKSSEYLEFLFDCLLHVSETEIVFFGESVKGFFAETIDVKDGRLSRFELLCWCFHSKSFTFELPEFKDVQQLEVVEFFDQYWLRKYPQHRVFRSERKQAKPAKAAGSLIHVVANWDSVSGLTENAHMSVAALEEAGVDYIQLYPSGEVYQSKKAARKGKAKAGPGLLCDVVLLHVNADEAPQVLVSISKHVDIDKARIIGFYLWELEKIPKAHELGIDLVDQIWTPSRFVESAYGAVAKSKTRLVGKALQIPESIANDRTKFSIPEGAVAYMVSFDYHSGVERKNPQAAIQGFLDAFNGDENVCLVLKTTEFVEEHWGDPFGQWFKVKKLAESDSRIVFVEGYLDKTEFFELINCCDVMVSTHRSEGFGYLPAYALALNKLAIVTDYSGSTDFCTGDNAYPVDYKMVPLPNQKFIYPLENPEWADVLMPSLVKAYKTSYQDLTGMKGVKAIKSDKTNKSAKAAATNSILARYSNQNLASAYLKNLKDLGVCK